MKRLWMVLVLLGLASGAWAQDFIRYTPPGGLSQLTTNGTTITSTLPLLFPNGTAAAPSISFSSFPTAGFAAGPTAAGFIVATSGVETAYINSTGYRMNTSGRIDWTNSGTNAQSGVDLSISREAAATLQIGLDAATATAPTFKGPDSTGANVAGASLTFKAGAGTSGNAAGGQLILQGGANAGSGEPGAVAIADGGTKPTCAAGIRGSLWYDAGGAGVLDTLEVCRKDAANNYAWVSLF